MSRAGHRAKPWMPDRHRVGSIVLFDITGLDARGTPSAFMPERDNL